MKIFNKTKYLVEKISVFCRPTPIFDPLNSVIESFIDMYVDEQHFIRNLMGFVRGENVHI